MHEIAARLNRALREKYGLARDVFYVEYTEYGTPSLALIDANDEGTMRHFAMNIEHLCAVFAEQDEHAGQLRLF